ncbi:MAG TPA: DUF6703 family protein [Pseudonocardiaceae bacterium]|nr:DUF6703 family protein [Pseudonocardiaceae bacterium]
MLPGNGPLARVPPVLAFVAVLAVFLLGVWLGGVPGAAMLVALAGGAGVLLAATWPRLSAPERTVRLLVIVVVLGIALERLA